MEQQYICKYVPICPPPSIGKLCYPIFTILHRVQCLGCSSPAGLLVYDALLVNLQSNVLSSQSAPPLPDANLFHATNLFSYVIV